MGGPQPFPSAGAPPTIANQPRARGGRSAYLDAVDDEGVAAEHPPQRSGLGVEGARAGVPAAREHCGHTAPLASRPRPLGAPRGGGGGVDGRGDGE